MLRCPPTFTLFPYTTLFRSRLLGEADGVLHLRLGLVVDRIQLLVGLDAQGADAPGEDADRVPLHPLLHLFLGAILGRVGDRVAAEAVGLRLEEEGQVVFSGSTDGVARRLAHLEHVVAVHDLRLHRVAARAHRHVLDRERPVERRPHGVLVVLADEDDGELPEPGEREALVEGAHVRRAVAEEAEGHVLLAAVLAPERDAGRDRHVPTDDRPAPEETPGGVEEVYRAAAPAAAPGRAPEELGHRAPRVTGAREVVRVLAVGGDDVVGRLGRGDRAHRDRLLSDVEVEEAAHLPLRVGLRRRLLEAAGEAHLAVEVEEQRRVHGYVTDYRRSRRQEKRRRPQSAASTGPSASCGSASPRAAARTGAKERRWTGDGPSSRMAAKCARVE